MRDLRKVANECMNELTEIGVPFGNVTHWEVNTRAKNRWGQCRKVYNTYTISISASLLDDKSSIEGLKNTIIHELLHTVEGGHGHTKEWAKWANYVNYKLGYNIKRTASAEEKGIAEHLIAEKLKEYKYVVECPYCHIQWKRMKMSNLIQNAENYTCGKCHSRLIRIK